MEAVLERFFGENSYSPSEVNMYHRIMAREGDFQNLREKIEPHLAELSEHASRDALKKAMLESWNREFQQNPHLEESLRSRARNANLTEKSGEFYQMLRGAGLLAGSGLIVHGLHQLFQPEANPEKARPGQSTPWRQRLFGAGEAAVGAGISWASLVSGQKRIGKHLP